VTCNDLTSFFLTVSVTISVMASMPASESFDSSSSFSRKMDDSVHSHSSFDCFEFLALNEEMLFCLT
jgi:hypothetical protein